MNVGPEILASVIVSAAILVLYVRRTWDLWQAAFGLLLVTLAAAGSSFGLPPVLLIASRVGLSLVILYATLRSRRSVGNPGLARALFVALWVCVAVAAATTVWSFDRAETLGHTLVLGVLVLILQESTMRRWLGWSNALSDLKVFFWVSLPLLGSSVILWLIGADGSIGHQGRLTGAFVNANMLGYLSALVAMIGFSLWVYEHRPRYLVGSIILVLSALLSESRTAALALALGVIWIFFSVGSMARVIILWLGATTTVTIFALRSFGLIAELSVTTGIAARFQEQEDPESLNGRAEIWKYALSLGADSVVGVGFGAAPAFLRSRSEDALVLSTGSAHNSAVQWFLETGYVGVVPYIGLLFICIAIAIKSWHRRVSRPLVGVALVGLLTQMTESMVFGTGQMYPWLFWPVIVWASLDRFVVNGAGRLRQGTSATVAGLEETTFPKSSR